MKHTYTDHQIIRFLYNECDLFEKLEMEFALEDDSTLLETFQSLYTPYKSLPKVTFSPQKSTVDFILNYSSKKLASC